MTSLSSCIGEGNGNPLRCSCLENPRDGGAWWAAVYGVAQSQTRLTRLSSSSSRQMLSTQHLPIKTPGGESLMSFPSRENVTRSQLATGRFKSIPCDTTGRIPLKSCSDSPWTWPHVPLPFVVFALHPFTGTHHSHRHD